MKRHAKGVRKSGRRRRSKPRNNAWNVTKIVQFVGLPESAQDMLLALPDALSFMREDDLSASAAARATGISRSFLIRRGRSGLKKLKNGRYAAKRNDHLFRPMIVVSNEGQMEVGTRAFREASIAGKHSAAVQRYLETAMTRHSDDSHEITSSMRRGIESPC